jgi:hypothetical protein
MAEIKTNLPETTDSAEMKHFYLSLTNNLCGFYLPFLAESSSHVREWATEILGRKIWCSVYDRQELVRYGVSDIDKKIVGPTVRLTVEDGILYDNY